MTETRAAPQTRRERQRLATYDEIVQAARQLLRAGDEVSVRAVAGVMGLTPPALYRYVDGHAGLVELVTRQIFTDVVESMGEARDRCPADDPAARIVAAATAFRSWALTNPAEFRMVFASPSTAAGPGCPSPEGSELFESFFAALFREVWVSYQFSVPTRAELDPAYLQVCDGYQSGPERQLLDALGDLGPGMLWLFKLAWARLYGIVTLEVFGHIDPELIESGAIFAAIMGEIGRDIGLAGEWDRLREVSRAEAVPDRR